MQGRSRKEQFHICNEQYPVYDIPGHSLKLYVLNPCKRKQLQRSYNSFWFFVSPLTRKVTYFPLLIMVYIGDQAG